MNISVLLKFRGYEYGQYVPNTHEWISYGSIQELSLRKEKIQKKRGERGKKRFKRKGEKGDSGELYNQ